MVAAVIGSQGGPSAENISVSNPFDDNAANSRAAPRPPGEDSPSMYSHPFRHVALL